LAEALAAGWTTSLLGVLLELSQQQLEIWVGLRRTEVDHKERLRVDRDIQAPNHELSDLLRLVP
jgi:hypothetical protein